MDKIRALFLTLCAAGLIFTALGCASSPTPTPDPREVLTWNGKTVSSAESFTGKIIYCTGDISVENGASLTLDYVTLYMSCESDAQYGIFVNPGGTLTITNESVITRSTATGKNYSFWYKEGSSGGIYGSTIQYTWTPATGGRSQFDEAGMFLEADNFNVINSTVNYSSGNGIEVYQGNNFNASGSTFNFNGANGLLIRNSDNYVVSGCNLSYNGRDHNRTDGCGLIFLVGDGTIEGNTIDYNYKTGLEASGMYTIKAYNNRCSNNGDVGIFLHDEIPGSQSYAEAYYNTCEANGSPGLCIEGTVEVFAHDNTLNNNAVGLRILNNYAVSTIESNTITNNTDTGVHVDNASPIFYRNTITRNGEGFLLQEQHGTANPNIGNTSVLNSGQNNLSGNTAAITNQITNTIKAENNWWGSNTKSDIRSKIYDPDKVDYDPWLSSAP